MGKPRVIEDSSVGNDLLVHGEKDVAVLGTAEALVAASTPCYQVTIQAKRTNTGRIYVGGVTVPNNDTGGIMLGNEESIMLWVTDLNKIFINSTVNGEGVTYLCWQT